MSLLLMTLFIIICGDFVHSKLCTMQYDKVNEIDPKTLSILNGYTYWNPSICYNRKLVSYTIDESKNLAYTATTCQNNITVTTLDLNSHQLQSVSNVTHIDSIFSLHWSEQLPADTILAVVTTENPKRFILQVISSLTFEPTKTIANLSSFGEFYSIKPALKGSSFVFAAGFKVIVLDIFSGQVVTTKVLSYSFLQMIRRFHFRGIDEIVSEMIVTTSGGTAVGGGRWKLTAGQLQLVDYELYDLQKVSYIPYPSDSILVNNQQTLMITWTDINVKRVGYVLYQINQNTIQASGVFQGNNYNTGYLFNC
jgi:hypothetical protein